MGITPEQNWRVIYNRPPGSGYLYCPAFFITQVIPIIGIMTSNPFIKGDALDLSKHGLGFQSIDRLGQTVWLDGLPVLWVEQILCPQRKPLAGKLNRLVMLLYRDMGVDSVRIVQKEFGVGIRNEFQQDFSLRAFLRYGWRFIRKRGFFAVYFHRRNGIQFFHFMAVFEPVINIIFFAWSIQRNDFRVRNILGDSLCIRHSGFIVVRDDNDLFTLKISSVVRIPSWICTCIQCCGAETLIYNGIGTFFPFDKVNAACGAHSRKIIRNVQSTIFETLGTVRHIKAKEFWAIGFVKSLLFIADGTVSVPILVFLLWGTGAGSFFRE